MFKNLFVLSFVLVSSTLFSQGRIDYPELELSFVPVEGWVELESESSRVVYQGLEAESSGGGYVVFQINQFPSTGDKLDDLWTNIISVQYPQSFDSFRVVVNFSTSIDSVPAKWGEFRYEFEGQAFRLFSGIIIKEDRVYNVLYMTQDLRSRSELRSFLSAFNSIKFE
ncbi:hypothetical protein [Phaeocystidibacter luteus]|uniref:DUF1795 domain-containing protein n=1 Tax=Phaeocystidibacter luteus TaxID=911197 RepID=A0A6N6RCR3_9FLAO|nr:hypothetical protein [Phaeocystidibacter luteus]KAB2805368.1 hypothetical protein F8C67_13615 [Phaeocystidibacter luteus]